MQCVNVTNNQILTFSIQEMLLSFAQHQKQQRKMLIVLKITYFMPFLVYYVFS